jgi:hypothetical protein
VKCGTVGTVGDGGNRPATVVLTTSSIFTLQPRFGGPALEGAGELGSNQPREAPCSRSPVQRRPGAAKRQRPVAMLGSVCMAGDARLIVFQWWPWASWMQLVVAHLPGAMASSGGVLVRRIGDEKPRRRTARPPSHAALRHLVFFGKKGSEHTARAHGIRATALIGAGGCLAVARTPRMAAAAAWPCPACERATALVAGLRWAKMDWVGLTDAGSSQTKVKVYCFQNTF